ncbi:MAG TPA: hypothetical protein DCY88_25275 [Cyanobacteria bacterium UBA11372]|nr:hypothetical protein [Cyanobacteria bacterium UBA11372]
MTTTPIQPLRETLDELEQQLELITQYLGSEIPEDKAAAEAVFGELEPKIEKKIDGYVGRINCLKANRDFRQSEAKRIADLAKHDAAAIAWLTDKLLGFMERRVEQLGERGRKLEGKLSKVSLCNNGGKPQVWINSEIEIEEFPVDYVKRVPTLDSERLKEDAIASPQGEIRDNNGRLIAKVLPRGRHIRLA